LTPNDETQGRANAAAKSTQREPSILVEVSSAEFDVAI
jgi:hypothetical protein